MKESILVTTEYLTQKEEEWKALLEKAEKTFLEVAGSAELLKTVFYGKPVLALEKKLLAQGKGGERAFGMLINHVCRLGDIALVYDKAERRNRDFFKKN